MKNIFRLSGAALWLLMLAAPACAGTTWYVDGKHGNDHNDCMSARGACKTIGHAISLASSGDTIMVAAATYTENLFIGSGINLTIVGAGAAATKIDGGYNNRVLAIEASGAVVSLSNLTIKRGIAAGGGGVLNWGTLTISDSIVSSNYAASSYSASGGGIFNYQGTLTINNTTFNRNGGSANQIFGGAIVNSGGTVTIDNSTFSANYSDGTQAGGGGGIWNDGTLTINSSTFSGNNATGWGGGAIYNETGTATISNSTISGNSASGSGGGGIYNTDTVVLQNSIVASNETGGDCSGNAVTSNGYNLGSDTTCSLGGPGDLNNTDPMLGKLRNNGGPTKTRALLFGSPAIDAGNPAGCTDGSGNLLTTDQRGDPRPDSDDTGGCDMGAYESD